MRLANKHANVQNIRYSDFSGGLNTTDAVENIAIMNYPRPLMSRSIKASLRRLPVIKPYTKILL